jgi:WD40 repeat protein
MISSLKHSLSATVLIALAALSGLAQKPELVVQTGHVLPVNSVAFSSAGKTLASGSFDGTIKLWDVATGRELRTLAGHLILVEAVAFTPNGEILASGSGDKTIKLWDVGTGKELRTLSGHSDSVQAVAFTPDGKILASGSFDGTINLWDVATGRELRSLSGQDQVYSVVFTLDGKVLASGSSDGMIKLWDVATGTELRILSRALDPVVYSVAFTPDGKILASGSADNTIKLWDVATGRELRTLSGHSDSVRALAFAPDGETLASGSADSTIKLWDVATGRELRTLSGHSEAVGAVAFTPDGKTLASGSEDSKIKLWDMRTGNELRTLSGHASPTFSVAFSPDGKTLVSGSLNKIKLWDVATGRGLTTLSGHPRGAVMSVAFTPDGKILASGSLDGTIKLWDVATGRELRTLSDHLDSVQAVAFTPDGKILVSGSRSSGIGDSTIKLWDVATGKQLRTVSGRSDPADPGYTFVFTLDGKMILASGTLDGKTIKLSDVATGRELRKLPGESLIFAFNPDGKTLASASGDGKTIKLWDVATGRELRALSGHSAFVTSVAFTPDGEALASGSVDNTIKLWNVATGQELASLAVIGENDWLVAAPDGLFDGSPAAWNQVLWRFNQNTFNVAPVESFFNEFYYPGLLIEIFEGKRPRATRDISQKDRRQPQVQLTSVTKPSVVSNKAEVSPEDLRNEWRRIMGRDVSVKIDISEAPAGAQDVRLFRNGSLVKVWRGDVLKGQSSVTLETTIPIIAGENRLTAYAFNRDNIKSSDATLTITGADKLKRKGVAYILAVGVNEYANTQYNLKYAVADAQDFAAELNLQQAKLNNYERVEVISLIDRDATKANILKSLTDLSAKVQPEDALIIYFAGHGTAQQNRFYLIPHDLGYEGSRTQLDSAGLQNILAHSVSDEELERAVEGIDAGRMLLVIDACNSGQALESEEKRRGPMNSKGLAQLAYEKGMYILTAAQSYQAAQEAARLGHGFLTYALVEEGLKTDRADRSPKDGQVLLREWLDYATERVPQMQQEKIEEQHKLGRQLELVIKFAESDAGTQRSVQRPRVFYRREAETSPLVVTRP